MSTGTGSTWISNTNWQVNFEAGNTYINQGLLTINTTGGPTWNGGTNLSTRAWSANPLDSNTIGAALNNSGIITVAAGVLNFAGGSWRCRAGRLPQLPLASSGADRRHFEYCADGAAVSGGTLLGARRDSEPRALHSQSRHQRHIRGRHDGSGSKDILISQLFTWGAGSVLSAPARSRPATC